ncbi:hypothetical protein [Amycolatopsis sp.]|uniref:hypothetical protein n=1 Tax=Amycolatopsis sp. TaxID=37632 RepID=UPI002DFF28DE|nr:hypothetical protein [Amycolatopsis sp.]
MAPDELPLDVLTELGRVTWAVIKLEDYAEDICARVLGNSRFDSTKPVRRKIEAALTDLAGRPASDLRDAATRWLTTVDRALTQRNEALHARPLVWVEMDPAKRHDPAQHRLGVMPRGGRSYSELPLTVESLGVLRQELVAAVTGWRDLVLALP